MGLHQGRRRPTRCRTHEWRKVEARKVSAQLNGWITIDPVPGRLICDAPGDAPGWDLRSSSAKNRRPIVTSHRGTWDRRCRHDRFGNYLLAVHRAAVAGVPAPANCASASLPAAVTANRANAGSDLLPVRFTVEARWFSTVRWLIRRSSAMFLLGWPASTPRPHRNIWPNKPMDPKGQPAPAHGHLARGGGAPGSTVPWRVSGPHRHRPAAPP
jgi:hypothetical protein